MDVKNSGPTQRQIRTEIERRAADLANEEYQGIPGTTRVVLWVHADAGSTVLSVNRNAVPVPESEEGVAVLWKVATPMDWNSESDEEWWLSGEGVKEQGTGYFDEIKR